MVIEMAGSSTWMSGSATGFSGSARVSPMVMSGMPAIATMSPGPALSPGLRSRPSVTSSSVMRTFLTRAVALHPGHVLALACSVPWWTRTSASRPRNGEASRLVTWACSGAPSSYVGAGIVSRIVLNSGSRSGESGRPPFSGTSSDARPALAGGVDDREVERVLAVVLVEQVHEQLVGLVDDLGDPGVAAVDLVDDQDDGHVGVERLAQHEAGLGERALGRVDEQHDAVDHRQAALDLATEVGVAGGVDDVDRHRLALGGGTGVVDRGVLREDRDPLLALQVAGVHDPVGHALGLVLGERAALAEHGVDEGGLAVVDVRDDGDVAQVVAEGVSRHGGTASLSVASGDGPEGLVKSTASGPLAPHRGPA